MFQRSFNRGKCSILKLKCRAKSWDVLARTFWLNAVYESDLDVYVDFKDQVVKAEMLEEMDLSLQVSEDAFLKIISIKTAKFKVIALGKC